MNTLRLEMRSCLITGTENDGLKKDFYSEQQAQTPAIFKMYLEMFIKGTTQRLEPKFSPLKGSIIIMSRHFETLLLILLMAYQSSSVLKVKGD